MQHINDKRRQFCKMVGFCFMDGIFSLGLALVEDGSWYFENTNILIFYLIVIRIKQIFPVLLFLLFPLSLVMENI